MLPEFAMIKAVLDFKGYPFFEVIWFEWKYWPNGESNPRPPEHFSRQELRLDRVDNLMSSIWSSYLTFNFYQENKDKVTFERCRKK